MKICSNKLQFRLLILLLFLVGIPIITMGILLGITYKTNLVEAINSLNLASKNSTNITSNNLLNISKKTIVQSNLKFANLSRKTIEENSKDLIKLNKYSLLNYSKQLSDLSNDTILSISNNSLNLSTDAILENSNNLIDLSIKSLKSAIISGNQEKAEKISKDISFSLDFSKKLLSVFGKFKEIKKMDADNSKYLLTLLQRDYPSLENISLVNKSGQEILRVSTNESYTQADLKDFSSSSEFTTAIKGNFYVSDVKISKRLYSYVTIAYPTQIYAGKYSGVLIADLNLSEIGSLVNKTQVGHKGYAFVVDSSGQVIFHPNKQIVLTKTNFSSIPLIESIKKYNITNQIFKLNNEEVLGVGTLVKNLNWVVIVIQPTSEAFEVSQTMKEQVKAKMIETINKIKNDTEKREGFAVKKMETKSMQAAIESQKNMYNKSKEQVDKSVRLLNKLRNEVEGE